ncbi:uncharacterized protein BX664DRAFT_358789 [Halteromyces radiatus]|uniref:uncharacterized protein n=1 Tax=Halteromyces radiatus TaxID=101107 RepID=UPI00221F2805|nr:uncharacterized protein BX664DRAFT_358789 [Halteromyces radiatus]KAI8089216.1 hypothetical protein BX664DRAFT_358789 [Halteromyces radiatus]
MTSTPDQLSTDPPLLHSPSSQTRTTTTTTLKTLNGSILRQRQCNTTQHKPPCSSLSNNKHHQPSSTTFDRDYTNSGFYDCNICFDTAIYPVLTVCGHLFCWVCLSRWLEMQTMNPTCPMCKAGCPQNKIIPVYGRGREEVDPRCDASIPTRPSGQRPEPLHNPNIAGSSFFYPFRTNHRPIEGHSIFLSNSRLSTSHANQSNGFLSRLMLMILSLFIVVIVFY